VGILRDKISTESIDLCCIDPPFTSNRTYNQIYNNIGAEASTQSYAFDDAWTWDDATVRGLDELLKNEPLRRGEGTPLAAQDSPRLKKTDTFHLHCDPTASH